MLRRIWPSFLAVLAYILLLLYLCGATLIRTTETIEANLAAAESNYRRIDDSLEGIRLNILRVAVLVREMLIHQRTEEVVPEIRHLERDIDTQINELRASSSSKNADRLREIGVVLHEYFAGVYQVAGDVDSGKRHTGFGGTPNKRETVISIALELSRLNDHDFAEKQKSLGSSMNVLRSEIVASIAIALLLSAAAAAAGLYRMSNIENRNQAAHRETIEARRDLQRLSRQLVTAQEDERKALSRELHDEIGQSLTALKLELAKSERIARGESSAAVEHLQSMREIADQVLRVSRDISQGLRPPMLDDLGLVAALNWHTDAFAKRSDIAVNLSIDGNVAELSESHRTCVFRIVQEALTNCARHAKAKQVDVTIEADENSIGLSIADDGAGFDPAALHQGLGLFSMRERSAELGGTFEIHSKPGQGTAIRVTFPSAAPVTG